MSKATKTTANEKLRLQKEYLLSSTIYPVEEINWYHSPSSYVQANPQGSVDLEDDGKECCSNLVAAALQEIRGAQSQTEWLWKEVENWTELGKKRVIGTEDVISYIQFLILKIQSRKSGYNSRSRPPQYKEYLLATISQKLPVAQNNYQATNTEEQKNKSLPTIGEKRLKDYVLVLECLRKSGIIEQSTTTAQMANSAHWGDGKQNKADSMKRTRNAIRTDQKERQQMLSDTMIEFLHCILEYSTESDMHRIEELLRSTIRKQQK